MRFLCNEQLSPHKYKTNEGYLVCVDAILARTGKQTYTRNEVFKDGKDEEVEIDRPEKEVFSDATLASFENKPITIEHPEEDVNVKNYQDYAVGFVRDVHKGILDGEPVMMGTLVITDEEAIREIEKGERTELSCGYDCDIDDSDNPYQKNIRGNHIALCEQGRAGVAKIVDSVKDEIKKVKGGTVHYKKIGNKYNVFFESDWNSSYNWEKEMLEEEFKKLFNDSIKDVEPRQGEKKEDFISRFMSETKSEYPDEKQRLAVAYSYWNKGRDSMKDSFSYNDFVNELKKMNLDQHSSTLFKEAKRGLSNLEHIKSVSGGWWNNIDSKKIYELAMKVDDSMKDEELDTYLIFYVGQDDRTYQVTVKAISALEAKKKVMKEEHPYRIIQVSKVNTKVTDAMTEYRFNWEDLHYNTRDKTMVMAHNIKEAIEKFTKLIALSGVGTYYCYVISISPNDGYISLSGKLDKLADKVKDSIKDETPYEKADEALRKDYKGFKETIKDEIETYYIHWIDTYIRAKGWDKSFWNNYVSVKTDSLHKALELVGKDAALSGTGTNYVLIVEVKTNKTTYQFSGRLNELLKEY